MTVSWIIHKNALNRLFAHNFNIVFIFLSLAIELAFDRPSYIVDEEEKNDVVSIIKVDDRITEQELEVIVELSPGAEGTATVGMHKCSYVLIVQSKALQRMVV